MATTKNGIYYPSNYSSIADVPMDLKKQAESIDVKIDDFNSEDTNIKADIQELEENIQTNATNISNIKKEQVTQNENIATNIQNIEEIQNKDTEQDKELEEIKAENERLRSDIDSISITEEAEGESIAINDTSKARFKKFEIEGNSKQETSTQSANILDLTKVTVTERSKLTSNNLQQNEIELTSTEVAAASYLRFKTNLGAGTWYFSRKFEVLSELEGSITGQCIIQKVSDWAHLGTLRNNQEKISFTLTENTEVYIALALKSAANPEAGTISARFYDIMLSNQDIDYVPFTPEQPSFDYPSEVKTVKDNINVVVCNKNLAKINETDWELTENNTIKNKAKNSGKRLTTVKLKKGQLVKMALKLISKPSVDTTFTFYEKGEVLPSGGFAGINNMDLNTLITRTYTAKEDIEIFYTMWGNADSETFEFQLWIELNEVTEYVKYEEQRFTIPVQQEMLEGDGFEKIDGVWKEIHNWGIDIDNGTKSWTQNAVYPNVFYRRVQGMTNQRNKLEKLLCNQYKYTGTVGSSANAKDNTCFVFRDANDNTKITSSIYICNSKFNTVSELQDGFKANNLKLYFPLETQILLECTAEQKAILDEIEKTIHSYKEVTNIYATDEVSPIFKVEAIKDTNTVINNLLALSLASGEK